MVAIASFIMRKKNGLRSGLRRTSSESTAPSHAVRTDFICEILSAKDAYMPGYLEVFNNPYDVP